MIVKQYLGGIKAYKRAARKQKQEPMCDFCDNLKVQITQGLYIRKPGKKVRSYAICLKCLLDATEELATTIQDAYVDKINGVEEEVVGD